ncbi:MAG: PIN domain protein [Chloroflexi bacterium CG_4_10_14_0_8_um_filter_57_5]|nr:MAG: PIN domain protein [Anaerolineae bacterium CG2_30_58_95]PIU91416.1 MAG: PIN domain protein [Anaerolineae bacterium CG06_land_8_20_14_3_00_57_67]PIW19720.1 MAG: PIN domain protein [Anaerolineae bacterium CG17_big_fil_post_rev_8_21_14_2_50_57_27]PIZ25996.1 MAG: PIN domain protein [Chloroflexi bacterium CG_4_10_14_0_8_um_filter_57_5]
MIRAVADTHTLIWYLFEDKRLSRRAKQFIDIASEKGDQIGFSAISVIEIVYLIEKAKINPDTLTRLLEATAAEDAALVEIPVTGQIADRMRSAPRESIPDMPDRIVAATALNLHIPVISRDGRIKVSKLETIW